MNVPYELTLYQSCYYYHDHFCQYLQAIIVVKLWSNRCKNRILCQISPISETVFVYLCLWSNMVYYVKQLSCLALWSSPKIFFVKTEIFYGYQGKTRLKELVCTFVCPRMLLHVLIKIYSNPDRKFIFTVLSWLHELRKCFIFERPFSLL